MRGFPGNSRRRHAQALTIAPGGPLSARAPAQAASNVSSARCGPTACRSRNSLCVRRQGHAARARVLRLRRASFLGLYPSRQKKAVPHVACAASGGGPVEESWARCLSDGRRARATTGEDGILLMLLSATLRLCVVLLFPSSLRRLGGVSARDWGHTARAPLPLRKGSS